MRLSVPWAANEGDAIRGWLSSSVASIHSGGQTVSALGGETEWVSDPSLLVQWMVAAHRAAPFDSVQLDVEPWTSDANWISDPLAIAGYVALVEKAQVTAHELGMTLDLDAPWWLATTPYLSGTVLSALLPHVDGIAVVAYADHAGGTDGIIAQAWTAVTQTTKAGVPFTIGVQTSSAEISGGAQYTFAGLGSKALEAECAKVRAAYETVLGYSGVTIEEYLSWSELQP